MSRKKMSDINPGNVGELFLKPGEDIPYRLEACGVEPTAIMERVSDTTVKMEYLISDFKDYVLLKPVRPIEKPKPARADKGKKHQRHKMTLGRVLDGARACPTHSTILLPYGDKWQCPEPSCEYEEEVAK